MYEIEKIYPFDPQLLSGLEKWLLLRCKTVFLRNDFNKTTSNKKIMEDNNIKEPSQHNFYNKGNKSKTITDKYQRHHVRKDTGV